MALPSIHGTARLTRDAEVRYTNSGIAVTQLQLAFNSRKKNDAGEWVDDKVLFVKAEAWRETAEALAVLGKGTEVVVTGRLETESWTNKEGEKRSSPKLNIDAIGEVLRDRAAAQASKPAAPSEDPWGTPVDNAEPPF